MKKHKLLWLALLVAALVALACGVYFARRLLAENAVDTPAQALAARTLQGEIIAISATGGEGWALTKESGAWRAADDATFPLDAARAAALADKSKTITATAKVKSVLKNPAQYGLDTPNNIITLTTDTGDSVSVSLGDTNARTGYTYMTLSGDTALYTVDAAFVRRYSVSLHDMITLEKWPVTSASHIASVNVKNADGAWNLNFARNDKDEMTCTVTADGGSDAVDKQAAAGILKNLASLHVLGCAGYNVQAAASKEYGLDAPIMTLTVLYTDADDKEKSIILHVGSRAADGSYYTQIEGSTAVDKMESAVLGELLTMTPSTLRAVQKAAPITVSEAA